MHPETVPDLIVGRVRGIASLLEEQRRFWREATGQDLNSDLFFTSVVVPFVVGLLKGRRSDVQESELRELFDLIELLTEDENPAVRALIDISFCEQLLSDSEAFDAALAYMGPSMKAGALTIRRNLLGS